MNKGVLENRSVLELYKEVVDDVLNNVRGLFLEEGIDETVLHQLQELWETKLIQTGAIGGTQDESYFAPETFQPQAPQWNPTTSAVGDGMLVISNPVPSADFSFSPAMGAIDQSSMNFGRPQQYMTIPNRQQFGTLQETAQALPNINIVGGAIDINQQQWGVDSGVQQVDQHARAQEVDRILGINTGNIMPQSNDLLDTAALGSLIPQTIPQTDGPGDDDWDDQPPSKFLKSEDGIGVPSSSAGFDPHFDAPNDSEGDDLNSDDDDDDEQNADDSNQDLVLAQYDKVTRMKSKWKTTLKDGVMNLNGRDYIFKKASCEFDWA